MLRTGTSVIFALLSLIFVTTMAQEKALPASEIKTYVLRLKPHALLKEEIMSFAKSHRIKAGIILTAVGSLEQYVIRFANQHDGSTARGHFEIVSLTGTFSDSSAHIHLSVSDSTGKTIGGHLLDGNQVYTTVEIALGELPSLEFTREPDSTYGYPELVVRKRKRTKK